MTVTLNSSPIVLAPSATAGGVDLITSAFANQALAAGKITLSSAQQAILPTLITAASRAIVRFCQRPFALQSFTEIVTPEGGRQDRGEPASAKLAYFPVQSVTRCASGRATVLLVANMDPLTNQEAFVQLATTGDVETLDLVATGLALTRTAAGAATTAVVPWTTASPYTTIAAMQSAINVLGGGWRATLPTASGAPDFGLLPAAYLLGVREPKDGFSPGAGLDAFTRPLSGYDVDRPSGILRCYGDATLGNGLGLGPGWGGAGLGDPFGTPWDGCGGWALGALGWPQVQVTYTAGFPTIPEPIQQVCAELVKSVLDRLSTSTTLQSLATLNGAHQQTVRASILALPDWAMQVLTFYKDWRV